MRARFSALLPIAAAAALAMGGGGARALTIRYSFTGGASEYTGGTIEVGSLDQALSTGPVAFTVEEGGNVYAVNASNFIANSTEIDFSTSCGIGCFESWNPSNFNFGAITPGTTWRSLLGTFNGSDSGVGDFSWSNSTRGGSNIPRPSAITFSADVPGPLPALGSAAAFGWSRRLRKRISVSASSRDLPSGSGC